MRIDFIHEVAEIKIKNSALLEDWLNEPIVCVAVLY